jgi:hypothetical protein
MVILPAYLRFSIEKCTSKNIFTNSKTKKAEMKKTILGLMALTVLFASSCKKDEVKSKDDLTLFGTKKPLVVGLGPIRDTLVGEITVNTTVSDSTVLQGIVYVKPGVTLTVNAGVTIFGSAGPVIPDLVNLANNKGTLVIEKGGKLIANGTANSPIVWTSLKAPGSRAFGDWGGVVLLGQAPISAVVGGVCASSNVFEAFNIAGFPNPTRNNYGGSNTNDNSGSMQYNRLEFGGGVVAVANKEVNGLTLCGVGKGTTIDFVEVTNSGDDAFEWFGGTVDCKHLVSFGNKDDDFDFDEGYNGNLQFIIGYRTTLCDNSGSHLIETDNNPTNTPGLLCALPFLRTQPFIANASLIAEFPGSPTGGGFFDTAAVAMRRLSSLVLANSIIKIQPRYPRAVATSTSPFTANWVAQGVSVFPSDSIYIGVNRIDKASFGTTTADGVSFPISGVLNLPLQGTANSVITDLFQFPTGGFNLNPIRPFFTANTAIGAIPSTLPFWIAGTWLATTTN